MLIGPPASGKSTTAQELAAQLQALVLSTDVLREELWGDAAIQGPWPVLERVLHSRIRESVEAGRPVLIDATHARRRWRRRLIHESGLPAEVRWVGWWMQTPLSICLVWNRRRTRQVPEAVIRRFAATLSDPQASPTLSEGFAALHPLDPSRGGLQDQIRQALEGTALNQGTDDATTEA
ncbi:MAG: ATP-binding protein [Synechococcus sp. BS301-5m-G54]|nr:ATP-binding protein [Synechococcus sp. BS301-5m-G54]MBL6796725.1 ATP-binding protein [Synechococcus sp. BS307-5m-G34]